MADLEMQTAILHGDLIQRVNLALPGYDNYKLTAALDGLFNTALAAAHATNAAVQLAAGSVAGASTRVATAEERLRGLARNVHSYIEAIPEEDASQADKMAALVALGFEQGEIGVLLDTAHLFTIIDDVLMNNASLPGVLQIPATIVNRMVNWKGVYDANVGLAGGGGRETLTLAKNDAKAMLLARIGRVRLFLCSCSDLGEQDPVLASYDFQPKRDPGDAQPQPKPLVAGPATWDAAARMLSVAALPQHATRLKAWRKIAGGEAEPCGMSETTSVNAAETAPFIPGGVYELWVTGRNSAGDGPISNKITWTAPV